MEKNNLWILTEERPTIVVIKTIIEKSSVLKDLDIHLNNIVIEPVIKNNNFQHQYIVNNFSSSKIENIIIKTVSGNSSFVDFLVFLSNTNRTIRHIKK